MVIGYWGIYYLLLLREKGLLRQAGKTDNTRREQSSAFAGGGLMRRQFGRKIWAASSSQEIHDGGPCHSVSALQQLDLLRYGDGIPGPNHPLTMGQQTTLWVFSTFCETHTKNRWLRNKTYNDYRFSVFSFHVFVTLTVPILGCLFSLCQ